MVTVAKRSAKKKRRAGGEIESISRLGKSITYERDQITGPTEKEARFVAWKNCIAQGSVLIQDADTFDRNKANLIGVQQTAGFVSKPGR
jgi:hypothetical protein